MEGDVCISQIDSLVESTCESFNLLRVHSFLVLFYFILFQNHVECIHRGYEFLGETKPTWCRK